MCKTPSSLATTDKYLEEKQSAVNSQTIYTMRFYVCDNTLQLYDNKYGLIQQHNGTINLQRPKLLLH